MWSESPNLIGVFINLKWNEPIKKEKYETTSHEILNKKRRMKNEV